MRLSKYFRLKPIVRWFLKVQKIGSHKFSWQSLLLSATVLNDKFHRNVNSIVFQGCYKQPHIKLGKIFNFCMDTVEY